MPQQEEITQIISIWEKLTNNKASHTVGEFLQAIEKIIQLRLSCSEKELREYEDTKDAKRYREEAIPLFKYLSHLIRNKDIRRADGFYLPTREESYDAAICQRDNKILKIEVTAPKDGHSEHAAFKKGDSDHAASSKVQYHDVSTRKQALEASIDHIRSAVKNAGKIKKSCPHYNNLLNIICQEIRALGEEQTNKSFIDACFLKKEINKNILSPLQKASNEYTFITYVEKILDQIPNFVLVAEVTLIEQCIQKKLEKTYGENTRLIIFLENTRNCLNPYVTYMKFNLSGKNKLKKPELFSASFRKKLQQNETFSKVVFIMNDEANNCYDIDEILNNTIPLSSNMPI